MKQALIDRSGAIAAHLLRRTQFDLLSSADEWSNQARGPFDLIVCSAVSASGRPLAADDTDHLHQCLNVLECVPAKRVVLISSIEVFADPRGVDEDVTVEEVNQSAPSKHLYEFEQAIRQQFDALVVRMPSLFGSASAANRGAVNRANNSSWLWADANGLQLYCLDWLWRDIQLALRHDLSLVHFATEPLRPFELAQALGESVDRFASLADKCDARSYLATLYGGHGGYLYTREQVLDEMRVCAALAGTGQKHLCRAAQDVAA